MEFPKIGDKYRNNNLGRDYVVFDVDKSIDRIQLKDLDGQRCDVSTDSLPIFFTKTISEIEVGSRWLLPNGRLITVSYRDKGQIGYYFGEAYCFTKVRFSKSLSNFLSDCSPFTGNLEDYDTSGCRAILMNGSVEVTSNDNPIAAGTSGDCIISQNKENRVVSTDTGMMFSNKKPLWKRILRKLV